MATALLAFPLAALLLAAPEPAVTPAPLAGTVAFEPAPRAPLPARAPVAPGALARQPLVAGPPGAVPFQARSPAPPRATLPASPAAPPMAAPAAAAQPLAPPTTAPAAGVAAPAPVAATAPAPSTAPPVAGPTPEPAPARPVPAPLAGLDLSTAPGPGLASLALPAAALLLLAVAALVASRRRRPAGRLLQVIETTAIGPRRSLVVARIGDELLVLGASEAGLQLLAARPAGDLAGTEPEPARLRPVPAARQEAPTVHPVLGIVARLRGARRAAPPPEDPGFDAVLVESAEDQELRRKLARGQGGSVR